MTHVAQITVTPRGAARLRAGHPWVRRDDVVGAPTVGAGVDEVVVVDGRGQVLGGGLWSATSPIAVRLLGREPVRLDEQLLDERIGAALARRRALPPLPRADAYRVVHGEADRLPGLFVDRYADVAVITTACAAMDAREPLIAEVVARHLEARLVVVRDDGAARDFEALPRRKSVLRGGGPTRVRYHDAGSPCDTDVLEDGKTGGFLDQQENHARAFEYSRAHVETAGGSGGGEALDAFTYHGGFALALARGGLRVEALDESAAAVERARANAAASGAAIKVQQANAFDALRTAEAAGRRYDVVVIDPPALAKRRSATGLTAAERGYKELNLRGIRLTRPGGVLITCSCSGKLSHARFGEIVEDAARDAGRAVQLLERRGAGRDHPPLLGVPETEYLKCWVLRVLG